MELQDVVDAASQMLGQPAVLEDRDFHLVAFHSQNPDVDVVRQRSILERGSSLEVRAWFEQFGIATAAGPISTPSDARLNTVARLCIPARWNGVNYGYIWVLDPDGRASALPAVSDVMQLAVRAGALLAQRAAGRYNAAFLLESLLSLDNNRSSQAMREIVEGGFVGINDPVVVMVVHFTPHEAVPINVWSLPRGVIMALDRGEATVLVRLSSRGNLSAAENVASEVERQNAARVGANGLGGVAIGIGDPQISLDSVRISHRRATTAARVAAIAGGVNTASWSTLGVYRLLAVEGLPGGLSDAVLDERVRLLLEHGGVELVRTARVFLDEAGSIRRSAIRLAVHRQTAYYRIRRIEELTGLDLARGDDRLTLHLGLKLAPFLDRREVAR